MTFAVFGLVIIAAVMHAFWNFAAKKVAGSLSLLWVGNSMAAVCCLPFAVYIAFTTKFDPVAIPYLLATSGIHVFYFLFLAKAYQLGDISTVYPIQRGIGVAGTAMLGYLLLGERISTLGLTGISLVCMGVLLMGLVKFDLDSNRQALFYCSLVGLTIAGYSIVDKIAVGYLNPILFIFIQTTTVALFLTPYVLGRLKTETIAVWKSRKWLSLAVGLCAMGTYILILFAFQLGQVSYIVPLREFAVVIGALLGLIFLKEKLTIRKGIGILIILAGLVAIKFA